MRKNAIAATFALGLSLGGGVDAIGATFDSNNVRPVTVNAQPFGEASLNDILNGGPSNPSEGLFQFSGEAPINVATGQSTAGMFSSATSAGTPTPTIIAEYTSQSSVQSFGIWFASDSGSVWWRTLFNGAATAGSTASLQITNGTLYVNAAPSTDTASLSTCGQEVNCSGAGGWSSTLINPRSFGFFFRPNSGTTTYYTSDNLTSLLNPSLTGAARTLAYRNGGTTDWAFAYEDGTDFDYNDMVVHVSSIRATSIQPVPEPSTLALMVGGLVALAGVMRRRGARRD